MKILSCSDIHLDTFRTFAKPVKTPISNSRLENILEGLKMFFKYGSEHQVKVYVFNGDTFNNRLKMNPNFYFYCVKSIVDCFRKAPEGSRLYINVGNHCEMTRYINPNSNEIFSSFSTTDHQIIVANKEAEVYSIDKKYNIMLVPFTEDVKKSKESISKELKSLNIPTYIFAHLGVSGAVQGRWSHKLEGAYNLDDLGWNNKYVKGVVLGHFHTRNMLYPQTGKIKFEPDKKLNNVTISQVTLDTIKYNIANNIINVDYEKGIIISDNTFFEDNNGYIIYNLKDKNNKYHTIRIHSIIAYLKYGDRIKDFVVDHINNKHNINNNFPSNLQLVTPSENLRKEATDSNNNIPCKAKNYFTQSEVHANSIYELSLRIKGPVSSIQKCAVAKTCNVAGDFLVAREEDDYREDITYNRFAVEGTSDTTGEHIQFNSVGEAERHFGNKIGTSHIGEVCRGTKKDWKGYTWKYISSHPDVWYQGDLIPINFNDVNENGLGASRGFDVIDTATGEHTFKPLTDVLPTFNIVDLEDTKLSYNEVLDMSKSNYVRIIVHNEEDYKKLKDSLKDNIKNVDIQLKKDIQENKDIDIDEKTSEQDIMKAYFKKYYPNDKKLLSLALEFLQRGLDS